MRRSGRTRTGTSLFLLALSATAVHAAEASADTQPPVPATQTPAIADITRWDHNGSIMRLDRASGTITYEEPKSSISKTIRSGDVLFQGQFKDGVLTGKAHVFKKGCNPAPYSVAGTFDPQQSTFELKGAAPRLKGCKIVGSNPASLNSRLEFRSLQEHADEQGKAITSIFTEGEGDHCRVIPVNDDPNIDYAEWLCIGPMSAKAHYTHVDARQQVTFGEESDQWHLQPMVQNFNGLANNGRIEWRLRDGKPFATIFDVDYTRSQDPLLNLKITIVAKLDGQNSCHMAYISSEIADARKLALDTADKAETFHCGKDKPTRKGKLEGLYLSNDASDEESGAENASADESVAQPAQGAEKSAANSALSDAQLKIIREAAGRGKRTFDLIYPEAGISGAITEIKKCYKSLENKPDLGALSYCAAMDIIASNVDYMMMGQYPNMLQKYFDRGNATEKRVEAGLLRLKLTKQQRSAFDTAIMEAFSGSP